MSFVSLLALLAGLVAVLAAAAPASGPPGLAQAIAAKDNHAAELLAHPGVVGAGVGLDNGQPAVLVFTARDGVTGIPDKLDGVRVAVRVSGPIRALDATASSGAATTDPLAGRAKPSGGSNPTSYFTRPVPIGVSTGRADQCAAGTIGARLKSGSGNSTRYYALSNNHVYANENDAHVGDQIVQPGLYDSRPPCRYQSAYTLGTLSAWTHINFDGGNNTVDAAIALTDTSTLGTSTPSGGYGAPSSVTESATLNMPVQKYGRTTRLTHGTVCVVDWEGDINYDSGVAHFVNQIGICNASFSKAGDSGSLIVTDDGTRRPVGLLFAGSSTTTFANPISAVLAAFPGVSIDSRP